MPIPRRLAKVGISKQTAKGAAATPATYAMGVLDGAAVLAELTQDAEEVTLDTLTDPGVNRTALDLGAEWTIRAYPRVTPMLFHAALGAIATTGPAGATYTHTITPGTDLPYMTLFGRQGSDYLKVPDAKLTELVLSWEGAGPVELSAAFRGLDLTWLAGAFTITNDELDSGGKLRGAGGSFQLMTNGDVLAAAPIRAGELTIATGVEPVHLANTIKPADVTPGRMEITLAATLIPDDLLLWRRAYMGTSGGTAPAEAEVYGQFNLLFAGPDANTDLRVVATRVAFTGDFPDADPSGGPLELEMTGQVVNPAAGAAFTATMRNTVASY